MATKNDEQKLLDVSEKIKRLESEKKALITKVKTKERKERTRRLIQIGAIMDSMSMNNTELAEKFKNTVQNNTELKQWFNNLMGKTPEKDA